MTDPIVAAAADIYVSIPVNFGADNNLIRMAERDAFIAGAEWAQRHMEKP